MQFLGNRETRVDSAGTVVAGSHFSGGATAAAGVKQS